jgi:glycosyltransferase involved in cell wall biosynthesis
LQSLIDPRILVLRQENQGTATAANFGLTYCDTPFVARMDADDISMPQRLEKQLAYMKRHPDVGIVGAQVAPIGQAGVGKSLLLPLRHNEVFASLMNGRHGLAHSAIMIRTEVLQRLGGYWSYRLIDDWDMMLRVGEVSQLANLNEVLLHYRVHSGSLNGTSMWRMQRHIGYAIERAKRRQTGFSQISFEEFEQVQNKRPIWQRLAERAQVYALTQYRVALAEIYGSKRTAGYLRLVWAAVCSPSLTVHRILRVLRGKLGTKLGSV